MSETKLHLFQRLPKFIMLGHGGYPLSHRQVVVPRDTMLVFLSKPSRYLMNSVVTPDLYTYFEDPKFTAPEPPTVRGWNQRMYGPGDVVDDLYLVFEDAKWPGMGIHKLPLKPGEHVFNSKKGAEHGQKGYISKLIKQPGVYFIIACRAVEGQHPFYSNQTVSYIFAKGSKHERLQAYNAVTARLTKRRRVTTGLRKNANEPSAKRRKTVASTKRKTVLGTKRKTVSTKQPSAKRRKIAPSSK